MKRFWFFALLAAAIGTTVAWAINYQKYAHRTARFGPFTMGGDVTPASLGTALEEQESSGLARVEVVDGNVHDFGMMSPGAEGEHTFIIKSVGEEELQLRLGGSTCKCTLGELNEEALAPGEQTEVKLTWTVEEGNDTFGQSAQLLTNDPGRAVVQLEITGKITREVDVVPSSWGFGVIASGEPAVIEGTIYSFLQESIEPTDVKFSDAQLNDLAEIEVLPIDPKEEGEGIYVDAHQAFRVKASIKPGMRQGAISQRLILSFRRVDDEGNEIVANGDDVGPNYIYVPVKGRVIGALSMIPSANLRDIAGGVYLYDFGRIGPDEPHSAKAFVVLKGDERDNTTLTIGAVEPEGVVKATLGESKARGSMTLLPLEIELIRGSAAVERLGNNKDDYGSVWIESDNPKVGKMRIALKFAIEGR